MWRSAIWEVIPITQEADVQIVRCNRQETAIQLSYVREGYETFRDLDPREIALIEPLRTLRMIHYAAWIARRWQDPAFPNAFPWFNSPQYWQDHLSQLEQPPLPLY